MDNALLQFMSLENQRDDRPTDLGVELMYVKCSLCGCWMGVKPGRVNVISHSLCEGCYEQEMAKLRQEGAANAGS